MKDRQKSEQSILDFPRMKLCPEIWTYTKGQPRLKDDLRERILSTIREYLFKFSLPLKACHLYGGSASYQYTDNSDVDISVFTEWGDLDDARINEIQEFFKDQELFYLGHPVHFFIKTPEEVADLIEVSEAVYDVINDKWIVLPLELPKNFDPDVAFADMIEVAKIEANRIDMLFGSLIREYEVLKNTKGALGKEMDKKTILHKINRQIRIIKRIIDKICLVYKELKQDRIDMHAGLRMKAQRGKLDHLERFKQPEITWKYLERAGYLERMREIKNLETKE